MDGGESEKWLVVVAKAAAWDWTCGSRWAYLERTFESRWRKPGFGVKVEGVMASDGREVVVPRERGMVGGTVGRRLRV